MGCNDLSGTLSTKFCDLQSVIWFYIFFRDSGLTGTIHTEIGLLKNWQKMILDENKFTGIILTEMGNIRRLVGIYLEENRLQGFFLVEVGK